jgi:hypothetical protein
MNTVTIGRFTQQDVSRFDTFRQQFAPARVQLRSIKDVDAIGGTRGRRRCTRTQRNALLVNQIARQLGGECRRKQENAQEDRFHHHVFDENCVLSKEIK